MVRLYDTLARSVVEVSPGSDGGLTMYSCGPTVYRYAHIGNLRTFMMADLIRRAFEYQGIPVRQIQNITDVGHMTDDEFDTGEDKMLVSAGLEGKTPMEIAAYYTDLFFDDVRAINIQEAFEYPRATEYVPQMIEIIAKLMERGHAYAENGGVYFDVQSFPAYGRLSGNTLDQLQSGHRSVIDDPNKRHHADFLLWRPAGERRAMKWPSPWGDGFPGWHIECSAMSIALLGESFDLHTGGEDNVFPHHEDEIAQSEGAVGHPVVSHWVHGAHLLSEGKKMAKSANNFYDLRDLAARGHSDPLAARLLFLQSRYRAQMNFTLDALGAAERTLDRWRRLVAEWTRKPGETIGQLVEKYEERFLTSLNDDLDTPQLVALVAEVVSTDALAPKDKSALLIRWDKVLGLDLSRGTGAARPIPSAAYDLIEQREKARAKKDYSTADRIRHKILSLGIEVEDTPEGPKPRWVR
ncbi:MAG: cysteine--tRNA ligase [Actinomycetota bacterium]